MFIGKPRLDESVQNKAATLLVTDGALVALSKADARKVVDYMRPHRVPVGTVLIREGQTGRSDFMALVLGGEVTVENAVAHDGIVVSVLGPGSLIGEMGLIDQSPRSATCTAASDVALAMLTREALTRLIDDEPAVAARLLLAMSKRIVADHQCNARAAVDGPRAGRRTCRWRRWNSAAPGPRAERPVRSEPVNQ